MKKLMLIAFFGILIHTASQAQAVVVGIIPPVPSAIFIRPACPGPGHMWINGSWRWDRRMRKNIWIEGYWSRGPQRFHHYGRGRRW